MLGAMATQGNERWIFCQELGVEHLSRGWKWEMGLSK